MRRTPFSLVMLYLMSRYGFPVRGNSQVMILWYGSPPQWTWS